MGPLTGRVATWTGREVLILGQAGAATVFVAYDPAKRAWRRLPASAHSCSRVPCSLDRQRPCRLGLRGRRVQRLDRSLAAPASTARDGLARDPHLDGARPRRVDGFGGAAYRPGSGWRRLPRAPLTGPAGWTGKELIVVSGRSAAAFTPGRGWRLLPRLPEARPGASVVWDGSELLVVGGDTAPARGFAYSPTSDTWRELAPADSGRKGAAAVWTGKQLLQWGGQTGVQAGSWSRRTGSPTTRGRTAGLLCRRRRCAAG